MIITYKIIIKYKNYKNKENNKLSYKAYINEHLDQQCKSINLHSLPTFLIIPKFPHLKF